MAWASSSVAIEYMLHQTGYVHYSSASLMTGLMPVVLLDGVT